MKYLIVDDEVAAREDLEKVLRHVEKTAQIRKASGVDEALRLCEEERPDVVLLDIRMPKRDGLTLAKEVKRASPYTNIIITTAYPEYALQALGLYVSGYLLKPVLEDQLQEALRHLRHPVPRAELPPARGLYVRCFGNFEVFYDGKPIRFRRSKAKETLAYLIDRRGATATLAECCAILWEDEADGSGKKRNYFHQVWKELKSTLESVGCADILSNGWNAYAIRPERIRCDYYEATPQTARSLGYRGEYMIQYSWAEGRRLF